jgi:hypothetical protein
MISSPGSVQLLLLSLDPCAFNCHYLSLGLTMILYESVYHLLTCFVPIKTADSPLLLFEKREAAYFYSMTSSVYETQLLTIYTCCYDETLETPIRETICEHHIM